jgi:hypothetical protein
MNKDRGHHSNNYKTYSIALTKLNTEGRTWLNDPLLRSPPIGIHACPGANLTNNNDINQEWEVRRNRQGVTVGSLTVAVLRSTLLSRDISECAMRKL